MTKKNADAITIRSSFTAFRQANSQVVSQKTEKNRILFFLTFAVKLLKFATDFKQIVDLDSEYNNIQKIILL